MLVNKDYQNLEPPRKVLPNLITDSAGRDNRWSIAGDENNCRHVTLFSSQSLQPIREQ